MGNKERERPMWAETGERKQEGGERDGKCLAVQFLDEQAQMERLPIWAAEDKNNQESVCLWINGSQAVFKAWALVHCSLLSENIPLDLEKSPKLNEVELYWLFITNILCKLLSAYCTGNFLKTALNIGVTSQWHNLQNPTYSQQMYVYSN